MCRFAAGWRYIMNKTGSVLKFVVGLVAVVAALTAAVTAYFIYMDKKQRDEEELEHYLDCSIQ